MSMPTTAPARTAQQIAAADPTRSVWVSANAGTGKTHVLVDRIARLLLAGAEPGRILCLTFTKAAAAEMANRLSQLLGAWTHMDDRDLTQELRQLTRSQPSGAAMDRARRLFAETLDEPEGVKVRTIHSFCESLLGRFPLEAGIAPHFSVLDERSAAELRTEARDRVLSAAFNGADDAMDAALQRLAGLVSEDGFAGVMTALDRNRGRLQRIVEGGGPAAARRALAAALGIAGDDDETTVLTAASDDGAFDGDGLSGAAAALDAGSPADKGRAGDIRAWLAGTADDRLAMLRGAYARVFLTAAGKPVAEGNLATKRAQAADGDALDVLRAEQGRVHAVMERLKAVRVAEATDALLRVGDALLAAYEAMKQERARLDYDDLIGHAARLLEAGGQPSWVHFKLDRGIEHILVDEAQDTSPRQWAVIRALAEEFFSGEGAAEGVRTVFAVGDEKQSIYGFQGADPEEFERMRVHFEGRVRGAGGDWQTQELAESFRSVPVVLAGVDAVFARPEARDGLSAHDAPTRHPPRRTDAPGSIEMWPTLRPAEDAPGLPWDAPLDQVAPDDPPALLAGHIAACIAGWLERGEVLEAAGRPVRPGDIMILVRRRAPFADLMVRQLKQRAIPVAGNDRMVLTELLAVMDLMALGRFVLLPEDDLTLASVLKGPLFGFDDDDLFQLAWERHGSLWQRLAERRGDDACFAHAHGELARLRAKADLAPPFEFFADVLGLEGGRVRLLTRLGTDAGDPIDEFLALALHYEADHVPSLQGFLHWLEAGQAEVKRDLELARDEVRVLTVHGAKGLESEIVFLPDTCTVPDLRHDPGVYWRDDAAPPFVAWPAFRDNEEALCTELREKAKRRVHQEYRRLLYVAMTRARDRLYVCGWETKRGRAEGCWYDLVAHALEDGAEEVALEFGATGRRLGSAAPATGAPAEAPAAGERPLALPEWARRDAPAEADPQRPLAPSRPSDDEPSVASPLDPGDEARFRRGLIVHALLKGLPGIDPPGRRDAARAYLARPAHGLGAEARDAILAETMAVLESPELAPLFGPGSRAQVPFVGTIGAHVVSGQIDRLLVTDEVVTVVDFKTNRTPPGRADDVAPLYLAQMAAYRAAMGRIYPGAEVRCFLLWTHGPRAMTLPQALLDAHAP